MRSDDCQGKKAFCAPMGGILIEDVHRFTHMSYPVHPDVRSKFLMNMNALILRLDRYQNIGAF
jgi:hypothetical protein